MPAAKYKFAATTDGGCLWLMVGLAVSATEKNCRCGLQCAYLHQCTNLQLRLMAVVAYDLDGCVCN